MDLKKNLVNTSLLFITVISATNLIAGSVTIPNTFSSGTAAVASEVNDNFSALETAVDDNDSSITSNNTRLDSNDSDIGNLQGRVTALESTASSVISLGHTAFKGAGSRAAIASAGDCLFVGSFGNYIYPEEVATASNDQCFASAGVQLPDGATISRLECTFFDNSVNNDMNVHLVRTNLLTGTSESILRTEETFNASFVQARNDTTFNTSGGAAIDNSKYAYNLFLNFSTTNFTSLGTDARLYGCRITVN